MLGDYLDVPLGLLGSMASFTNPSGDFCWQSPHTSGVPNETLNEAFLWCGRHHGDAAGNRGKRGCDVRTTRTFQKNIIFFWEVRKS